jgi:hypothetical protein
VWLRGSHDDAIGVGVNQVAVWLDEGLGGLEQGGVPIALPALPESL